MYIILAQHNKCVVHVYSMCVCASMRVHESVCVGGLQKSESIPLGPCLVIGSVGILLKCKF